MQGDGAEVPRVERVVYRVAGMDDVVVRRDIPYIEGSGDGDLTFDVYSPPGLADGERRPAVVFVHGGAARTRPIRAKEHGVFQDWGRLVATCGLVGITFNHRRAGDDWTALAEAASDVDRLIEHARMHGAELGIDVDRLALFTFSAAPPVGLRSALRDRPPFVRCLVVHCGILDLRPYRPDIPADVTDADLAAYSPAALLGAGKGGVGRAVGASVPPLLVVRAGRDDVPHLNESIDVFVRAALTENAPLTLITHPNGRHAFATMDDVPRSHEIIRATLAFLKEHLVRA